MNQTLVVQYIHITLNKQVSTWYQYIRLLHGWTWSHKLLMILKFEEKNDKNKIQPQYSGGGDTS